MTKFKDQVIALYRQKKERLEAKLAVPIEETHAPAFMAKAIRIKRRELDRRHLKEIERKIKELEEV